VKNFVDMYKLYTQMKKIQKYAFIQRKSKYFKIDKVPLGI